MLYPGDDDSFDFWWSVVTTMLIFGGSVAMQFHSGMVVIERRSRDCRTHILHVQCDSRSLGLGIQK